MSTVAAFALLLLPQNDGESGAAPRAVGEVPPCDCRWMFPCDCL